jgi:uracil-DNA glycosylase family 4
MGMESDMDWHNARALLEWQLEMGVNETILDTPIDRYALDPAPVTAVKKAKPPPALIPQIDPVAIAQKSAEAANSIEDLKTAMGAFNLCELKLGARNLVFSDGSAKSRVMIIGEAPGREEDQKGKPFVGRAGQLLDKMLGAIAMDRASQDAAKGVYITNVLPWRPAQNRDPKPEEIAMMWPFLQKHIALVNPSIVIAMGNISCQALLGETGITKLRGRMQNRHNVDVLPMFHPAYLLRNPSAKKHAWADLLTLKARLEQI